MATEPPNIQFLNFLEDQEIKFIHVGSGSSSTSNLKKNSEFVSTINSGKLSEENVIDALEIILDSSKFFSFLFFLKFIFFHQLSFTCYV